MYMPINDIEFFNIKKKKKISIFICDDWIKQTNEVKMRWMEQYILFLWNIKSWYIQFMLKHIYAYYVSMDFWCQIYIWMKKSNQSFYRPMQLFQYLDIIGIEIMPDFWIDSYS